MLTIPVLALIVSLLLAILVFCICAALLCTRGDPWTEEMGVDTSFQPKSIVISSSVPSVVKTSVSTLPPIDEDVVRVMENDPSGGVALDRMDRATAEALAVERILKEGQSSPLFDHIHSLNPLKYASLLPSVTSY
ncbi:hypothetical protein PENTCL1PPCAC_17892, partial [Pristionchus entomophagus]